MKDLHEGYQVINPEDEVINNTLTWRIIINNPVGQIIIKSLSDRELLYIIS